MIDETTERRRFTRVPFDTEVSLYVGEQCWQTQLIDVSLKGLLVDSPDDFIAVEPPHAVKAVIHLAGGTEIHMETRFAHNKNQHLGFECESIDIESMTHLRRLVELNIGDPAAAERELSELAAG